MNAETLAALRGSIEKWRAIVDGTAIDDGVSNYMLCNLFLEQTAPCDGCPVADKAQVPGCYETPYFKFKILRFICNPKLNGTGGYAWTDTNKDLRDAAMKELNFLKSLLPEGK